MAMMKISTVSASRGIQCHAPKRAVSPGMPRLHIWHGATGRRVGSNARVALRGKLRATQQGNTPDIAELVSSSKLLVNELRGLGMPEGQVEQYLLNSTQSPSDGYESRRSIECLKDVMMGSREVQDAEALEFVSEQLRGLWMWKRRKGDYFGGDGEEMYQVALSDIQDVDKKALEKMNSEKIQSVLLDGLDMTEEDKALMGDAIRGVAVGGIQTVFWNAIGIAVVFLVLINFVGRG